MKQINQELREADTQFRALNSLNQAEYEQLLFVFDELVTQKLMHYTLKGKRRAKKHYKEARNSSLWGSQAKLDFLLLYLKHNRDFYGLNKGWGIVFFIFPFKIRIIWFTLDRHFAPYNSRSIATVAAV